MTPANAAWALLIGFLGIVGAYVALVITGHADAAPALVSAVVSLIAATGLGVHFEKRTREQNATIAKIDRQTNGVLDGRIREGTAAAVAQVLTDHGVIPPAKPAKAKAARKRAPSSTT